MVDHQITSNSLHLQRTRHFGDTHIAADTFGHQFGSILQVEIAADMPHKYVALEIPYAQITSDGLNLQRGIARDK